MSPPPDLTPLKPDSTPTPVRLSYSTHSPNDSDSPKDQDPPSSGRSSGSRSSHRSSGHHSRMSDDPHDDNEPSVMELASGRSHSRLSGRSTSRERRTIRGEQRGGGSNSDGRRQMVSADAAGFLGKGDSGGVDNQQKAHNVKRRRSYDSTLFGLDVFEGLQADYQNKRKLAENENFLLRHIPVILPTAKVQQWRDLASVFIILYEARAKRGGTTRRERGTRRERRGELHFAQLR